MLHRHRLKLFIGLVLAQVLFLAGIAGSSYAVGWFGKEVRIQTAPVDPRDLLYGDYVILNYEISLLNRSLWKDSSEPAASQGKAVYVVLKPESSEAKAIYNAVGIYASKPKLQEDEVLLKGRIDYDDGSRLHIKYGLEKYYVPENSGTKLEQQAGGMVARIKVAPWGSPVIEKLEASSF